MIRGATSNIAIGEDVQSDGLIRESRASLELPF
jgi:hypothetical protein